MKVIIHTSQSKHEFDVSDCIIPTLTGPYVLNNSSGPIIGTLYKGDIVMKQDNKIPVENGIFIVKICAKHKRVCEIFTTI